MRLLKYPPRVSLHPSDAPWVASAAAIARETPKVYIERVLVPIAEAIARSGKPRPSTLFSPSPPTNKPKAFSVSDEDYAILRRAARIEDLSIKQLAEKYLVPIAKAEVVKWVMGHTEEKKIA